MRKIGPSSSHLSPSTSTQAYPQITAPHGQGFHFPASPHLPAHPVSHENGYTPDPPLRAGPGGILPSPNAHHHGFIPPVPQHSSELDAQYWKNMFLGLGFGNIDPQQQPGPSNISSDGYNEVARHQHQTPYQMHTTSYDS